MNMQMELPAAHCPALYSSPSQRTLPSTGNKMAAAGPSTRASSAAAAAALSRRGRRGRCDEKAAAKTGAPGPASGPALLVLSPPAEESCCAGCLETPGEAAALPCGHLLCRGCAQRAANAAGSGCPRCRARGPGWARRRARDDGQADAEVPGERARRGQPERCRPRRDGGAAAEGPRPEQEPRAAPAEPGGTSPLPCGVRSQAAPSRPGLGKGVDSPGPFLLERVWEFPWGWNRALAMSSMCLGILNFGMIYGQVGFGGAVRGPPRLV
jgi:hypothetical protein